jgi:hypothetical protein
LAMDVELHLRLQDQPLRDQKVVRGFQLGGEMALAADKADHHGIHLRRALLLGD